MAVCNETILGAMACMRYIRSGFCHYHPSHTYKHTHTGTLLKHVRSLAFVCAQLIRALSTWHSVRRSSVVHSKKEFNDARYDGQQCQPPIHLNRRGNYEKSPKCALHACRNYYRFFSANTDTHTPRYDNNDIDGQWTRIENHGKHIKCFSENMRNT